MLIAASVLLKIVSKHDLCADLKNISKWQNLSILILETLYHPIIGKAQSILLITQGS